MNAAYLLLVPSLAFGQVYKCGSTYQAQPCEGGKKLEIQAQAKPDQNAGRLTCEAAQKVLLKDPDSAKAEGEWAFAKTSTYHGEQAAMWIRYINAKNSYGGYSGAKPMVCYTTPDGSKFVGFSG